MSTPFPLEEEAQKDTTGQPVWNPWDKPAAPHWYSGMGFTEDTAYLGPAYRALASVGSATAKGELVLGGALHQGTDVDPESKIAGAGRLTPEDQARAHRQTAAMNEASSAVQADARERIKSLRPDPAETGLAVQVLHGLGEGLSTIAMSGPAGVPGAFAALSTTQGYSAFQDLREQGVAPKTAGEVAAVRGLLAGVGGVTPMTFGATLLPKLATSMASNVGFGMVGRGVDSHILRSGGYEEMADQEQVLDRTQLFVDLALGAGFGGWAHIHGSLIEAGNLSQAMQSDSALRDAALVANLALKDRRSGPGVPIDPRSAGVHAGALEKAVQDLQAGEHVNVAPTGVADSAVLSRGGEPNPKAADLLVQHLEDSGLLEEHGKLEALEAVLERKLSGEPITGFTTAKGSTYEITAAGTTVRNKSVHPEHPGDEGLKPESHQTYYVTAQDAETLAEIQTQGGARRSLIDDGKGNLAVRYDEGSSSGKIERRTVVRGRTSPAVGLTPVETWNNGRDVHFGNPITELRRGAAEVPAEHPTNAVTQLRPGPGEVLHEVDAENARMHSVISENGHTIAYQRGDQLQISDTRTAEDAQGKGEGMARMYKLLEVAKERGLTLTSDTKVSGAAQKQYARLEREGYEVVRNPAEADPEGNDNLIATAGRPIFEVKPKTPLPQRLVMDTDLREGLTALKAETGWAQEGGRVLMDETGTVTGRTSWIPREQWWADRPGNLNEQEVHAAVDKALAGKPLGSRQRDIVKFMTEVHDERVQRAGLRVELEQAVPDLANQPAAAVDLTVLSSRAAEVDREGTLAIIDSWADDTPETLTRIQNEFEAIIGRGHEGKEKFRLEAAQPRGGEPAPVAKEPGGARANDLFGEDRTREQQLHDELRRRDLARSPGRDVSLETGRPDDLFSQSRQQVDLTDGPSAFAVDVALKGAAGAPKPTEGATTAQAEEPGAAAAGRIADQAIAERPGLAITREDGSEVPAAYAKDAVDTELAQTEKAAPSLFQAMADCVLRNGQ